MEVDFRLENQGSSQYSWVPLLPPPLYYPFYRLFAVVALNHAQDTKNRPCKAQSLNPNPKSLHPKSLRLKPQTLNLKPQALHSKP